MSIFYSGLPIRYEGKIACARGGGGDVDKVQGLSKKEGIIVDAVEAGR